MKLSEKLFLARLAHRQGISLAEFVSGVQEAIDAAWSTTDPEAAAHQKEIFPEGKPTPYLFLVRLAAVARQKQQQMSDSCMTP